MKTFTFVFSLFVVVIGFFVIFGDTLTRASQVASTQEPLAISTIPGDSNLGYSITNRSTKNVVAYSLRLSMFDEHNKRGATFTKNQIWGFDPSAAKPYLAPGETWTAKKAIPLAKDVNTGVTAKFQTAFDFVLFGDGSTWGPDEGKQSLKIAGIREGWATMQAHLYSLSQQSGPNAVVDKLRANTTAK